MLGIAMGAGLIASAPASRIAGVSAPSLQGDAADLSASANPPPSPSPSPALPAITSVPPGASGPPSGFATSSPIKTTASVSSPSTPTTSRSSSSARATRSTAAPTPEQATGVTARPSATKKPAAPASTGCLAAPSACGYPDASNTGVARGTKLSAHPGTQTITKNGAVINGWDTGRIDIRADNVTIENTKITTSAFYGIHVYSGKNLRIENVTIIGRQAGGQECDVGIDGPSFVAERVNISGCEDGFHVNNADQVLDSYVHDLLFTSSSHNDGVQAFSGNGLLIKHNTIDTTGGSKSANACVFLQPSSGLIDSATIEDNLFDGGGYSVFIEQTRKVLVIDNRFGDDFQYAVTDNSDSPAPTTWSGNVDDATGNAV
jgi:Right handed beta helix region